MGNNETPSLKVLPLGGLGEIGLNMTLVIWEEYAFIVDAGLMFPDDSMPGIDYVIPDVDVITRLNQNILGIAITHAHEDHIGALPYLLKKVNAPIYATSLTMGFIENKFDEFDLLTSTNRIVISPDTPIQLGPFILDFFAMCHSVPDAVGIMVQTPIGKLIFSGDFKIDPNPVDGRLCDFEKLKKYADSGVLALFSDSTNVEFPGRTRSESVLMQSFEEIFATANGRVLIATFASNIHRLQQALIVAKKFDRKAALVGRSMAANARIASDRGYLQIPDDILVDIKDLENIPDNQVTVLSTGSQGEPMSALALMASERHKYLKVKQGDTVIFSSRFIPGNEKAINSMINDLARRGANVMYDKIADVHVSGHGREEELRELLKLVQPQYFVPIHGEYRHLLRHAQLAICEGIPKHNVMVATDGDVIQISKDSIGVTEQIDVGRIFVHGKGVGDIGRDVLKDRRNISEVGLITIVFVVSIHDGRILSGPELSSIGVTYEEIEPELMGGIRSAIMERISDLNPNSSKDWDIVRDEVRLLARRFVNRLLGRKPIVQTIIMEV
ncbi:MAG: ribonuclease J [Desulfomonilaceae bacterium]